MPQARDFKVFAGNSNLPLARRICEHLKRPLGKAEVGRFSDGEIQIEIGENVRGQDTFIVQSTCPPANDHIMELLIMCDALKRASAQSITAVIPYFGYARQDRKVVPRTPITAKLVADLLESAGATRVVSMDMHVAQIQGFFHIPSDHLFASPVFLEDIRRELPRHRRAGHRLPRRRRRGAGAGLLQAAQRLAGHRRQAAHPGQRLRGDEPHRRRGRHATRSSSTTWWTPAAR